MSGGDPHRSRGKRFAFNVVRRTLLSLVLTSVLVTVAAAALFVTSWPKWMSLLIEPLSLLLTPGVVASMIFTGSHDYTPIPVLSYAAVSYFAFFYVVIIGWDRHQRRQARLQRA